MAEERPGELGPLPSARIYEIARNLGHRSPHPYHVCLYLDELHALLSSASRPQPSAAPGVDRPPPCWAADGPFRCSREYGYAGQHHDIFSSHSGHVWDNEQPSAPERPFDRVWPLSGSGSAPRERPAGELPSGRRGLFFGKEFKGLISPEEMTAVCVFINDRREKAHGESDPSATSSTDILDATCTMGHLPLNGVCSRCGIDINAGTRYEVARPSSGGVPCPLCPGGRYGLPGICPCCFGTLKWVPRWCEWNVPPSPLPTGIRFRGGRGDCEWFESLEPLRYGGSFALCSVRAKNSLTLDTKDFLVSPDRVDWDHYNATWPMHTSPPAPLTGNDGTGGRQAGSEELHFCDYTNGPRICEGDACNGHTVKEMRAYDAGRASLEKRNALLEAFVERLRAYAKDGFVFSSGYITEYIAGLDRELSAGGTKP